MLLLLLLLLLLILFGVVLFPLMESSSFHELRAVISLVDYLMDGDILSMSQGGQSSEALLF